MRSLVQSLLLLVTAVLLLSPAWGASVVVRNGYEFHASLTSPNVTWVLVADNITFTLDTCPFPASPGFPATMLERDLHITSLTQAAVAAAARAGSPLEPATAAVAPAAQSQAPFWINCSYLNGRFELVSGHTLQFNNVVLINCRTLSTAGFITKQQGSKLVLNNTIEDQGSVCLPLPTAQGIGNSLARQPGAPTPPGFNSSMQITSLAPAGSNWCSAAQAGTTSGTNPPLPPQLLPKLMSSHSSYAICSAEAVLLGSTAWLEVPTPINASSNSGDGGGGQQQAPPAQYTMVAVNSAILCSSPVSAQCLRANGTDACLAAAYRAVNPDEHPPCPAFDGFGLHNCLVTPSVTRIVVLSNVVMNTSTCPSWLSEDPLVIDRNVTIHSDPRGPRLMLDCSHMNDRVQMSAGTTLTLDHMILANCSIGSEKPVSIVRLDVGSKLVLIDTFVLQPDDMCLHLQQQASNVLHEARPGDVAGVQAVKMGQPQQWCARQSGTRAPVVNGSSSSGGNSDGGAAVVGGNVDPTSSPKDNNSYSEVALPPLPVVYANRTGMGPKYAATLDQPATVAYYVNPTWPGFPLCQQSALLLQDFAYLDPFGWTLPPNMTRSAAKEFSANNPNYQPSTLQQQLGPGYNGTVTVHYTNSAWLCSQPALACASQPNVSGQRACLLAAYAMANPDNAVAAPPSRNYGVRVILPVVLGSVGGALLLAGIIGGLLALRHRRKLAAARESLAKTKGPYDPKAYAQNRNGWFGGQSSAASSDPARRLLGIREFTPAGTDGYTPASSADRSPGGQSEATSGRTRMLSPDGITLSMLLGAGSFGRVYSGVWNNVRVAVKVISHSAEDDTRISRELSLSLSFDHPNLVRSLHYARIRINPNSPEESLGTASTAGIGSLFLPEGAVGVFELPSTWAVIQKQGLSGPAPMIDTETWIVMDLMDRGNLAAAVRQGAFVDESSGGMNAASLLRRCADIAAGVTYLHSRNVCHGDLKCENILLRTEPQDPDGVMAAVADFGLSRALAFGQSHLSTRRYGTVTHMPPELLVAGKLTPTADVYSFGIMMWEMVSRTPPFVGLHHGEIIHKVVTQDLRPGPWPAAVQYLPPDYVTLAEACWARQSSSRPLMETVLQRLLAMLAAVDVQEQQQQQ